MGTDTDSDVLSLATVEVDRLTLAQWYESRQVARATAFRLLKVAGITPHKIKVPGSRALVSALDPAMVSALDALADRLRSGESMAQLEASTITALATRSRSETASDDPNPFDPAALLTRLQAAEKAIATGLPLSTREVSWLIGARPGAATITRGRLTATRTARNCWTLSNTNSAGS